MPESSRPTIKVHNHGHVALVDTMGDDDAIVQAARVSYGKGTKSVSEDRGLIRYLMRKRHTTPFEMCEVKLHLKLPIFVMRQWIRHRTASVNEYSGRYSEMRDEFYFPELQAIKPQSTVNKQGRDGDMLDSDRKLVQGLIRKQSLNAFEAYQLLINNPNPEFQQSVNFPVSDEFAGVAKEMARVILPLNIFTECYWKIDLHNLFHFLTLRTDAHAQEEIRDYANAICELIKPIFPVAYEAWEDYHRYSYTLSRMEKNIITKLVNIAPISQLELACKQEGMSKREIAEFIAAFWDKAEPQ